MFGVRSPNPEVHLNDLCVDLDFSKNDAGIVAKNTVWLPHGVVSDERIVTLDDLVSCGHNTTLDGSQRPSKAQNRYSV